MAMWGALSQTDIEEEAKAAVLGESNANINGTQLFARPWEKEDFSDWMEHWKLTYRPPGQLSILDSEFFLQVALLGCGNAPLAEKNDQNTPMNPRGDDRWAADDSRLARQGQQLQSLRSTGRVAHRDVVQQNGSNVEVVVIVSGAAVAAEELVDEKVIFEKGFLIVDQCQLQASSQPGMPRRGASVVSYDIHDDGLTSPSSSGYSSSQDSRESTVLSAKTDGSLFESTLFHRPHMVDDVDDHANDTGDGYVFFGVE